jgi:hypothetical protein
MRTNHSDSVARHLRADAAAGNHDLAGAGCPGRDRSTMSDEARAPEPRTVAS